MKPKVIAVVGPTATGKSDTAVAIAEVLATKGVGSEIISADSRQVYRGLDLGTGKITTEEMRGVPHHMLDVVDPTETYTVADYTRDAKKVVNDILDRGNVPIVCGGTGLYIDALLFDQEFPEVSPNDALRKELETCATETLATRLEALDAERFETIDTHNRVRLIRAIEIAEALGNVPKLSQKESPYEVVWIGLDTDTEILEQRITARLQKRMNAGMREEAALLHASGLSFDRMESLGLEYRYLARLLQNEITEDVFYKELTTKILQYAKRQRTWFKRNKEIEWFDSSKPLNLALMLHDFHNNPSRHRHKKDSA